MPVTRRDFLKQSVVVSTAAMTVGLPVAEAAQAVTKNIEAGWRWDRGVCRFCGVGCGLIANTKGGKLINVEGDPDHPINQGSLCSKGQAVFEVVTSPRRLKKVRYRAPGSDHWEEKSLDWAMTTLAQRVKATRDAAFITKSATGVPVNRTEALASIGGASINNEECYLISKLMRTLGVVYLEHQARL